jgi:dTDP-4-amino-4,6-dideoxygalactose transaminase
LGKKLKLLARRNENCMTDPQIKIPLMKPRLPNRQALASYLAEIDENRWYSNFGPLERRFEAKLGKYFGLGERQTVCVANGTQALSISLKSVARFPVGYCLMPSFTFAATPHAAVSAGLEPYFLDVDPVTWALDPRELLSLLPGLEAPIAAVVPVAPFGAAVDIEAWDEFQNVTGIPVVIDAAAGFDNARCGESLVMVSLHATKVMGIGEGGLVLCRDAQIAERVRAGRNFGFMGERVAEFPGINAKLSEYGAAVGLAALAEWPETRLAFLDVVRRYQKIFSDVAGVGFAPGFLAGGASSTCNIVLERPIASHVIASLMHDGIEARRWWNLGCHNEPAFAGCRREGLKVTMDLGRKVVGLPFYRDLDNDQIEQVRNSLARALDR